jgi:hypothetical protein
LAVPHAPPDCRTPPPRAVGVAAGLPTSASAGLIVDLCCVASTPQIFRRLSGNTARFNEEMVTPVPISDLILTRTTNPPAAEAQESRYRARIYRGLAITV